jgi:hypothetical protein
MPFWSYMSMQPSGGNGECSLPLGLPWSISLPQKTVIHSPGHQKTDNPITLAIKKQMQLQRRQLNDPTSGVPFCGSNLFSSLRDLVTSPLRPKWPHLRATVWTTKVVGLPWRQPLPTPEPTVNVPQNFTSNLPFGSRKHPVLGQMHVWECKN